MEISQNNLHLNYALCSRIGRKYIPFGFQNLLPESLTNFCGALQGKNTVRGRKLRLKKAMF